MSLIDLAQKHGTDKWGGHNYAQHYDRFFRDFQDKKINLLEIGVGGYDNPEEGGDSLRMWKDYFSKANIFGVDFYDKTPHEEDRIKVFQGSQDNAQFLENVVTEMGGVDVIIDDGSHVNSHVIKSFQVLFPLLSDDGLYVVEDTQASYWPHRGGDSFNLNSNNCSMGYFKSLVDGLNYEEFDNPYYSTRYMDKSIVGIHFFHNMCFIQKGDNNEGSNIVHNNRLGQKTAMQNLRYLNRYLLSLIPYGRRS